MSGVASMGQLWRRRELIGQLVRRDVSLRYKGAYLGVLWSVITPFVMLGVYSVVFTQIFQATWMGAREGAPFWAELLAGLVPFAVFAEVAGRGPNLVRAVPNYVKKVVFPLEVLPVSAVGAATTHSMVSLAVLVAGVGVMNGGIRWEVLWLPVMYLPLVLWCLGMGWFLASTGMYVRDLSEGVGPVVTIMNFVSPIFFSMKAVEKIGWLHTAMLLNPLATIIGGFRWAVLGDELNWQAWGIVTGIGGVVAVAGYAWFEKTKRGFADVI